MPHAAFYVVELTEGFILPLGNGVFQCRTRLSMWWNTQGFLVVDPAIDCFNAARGFLCGGTPAEDPEPCRGYVSMPHAAFYVVEQVAESVFADGVKSFNAARGFLCGGTNRTEMNSFRLLRFNAARGFLCGGT